MNNQALTLDAWLSSIMNLSAFRLEPTMLESFVKPDHPSFVYTKVTPKNIEIISKLEAIGFKLVDTNLQFEKPANITNQTKNVSATTVRFAQTSDQDAVAELSRNSFSFSRFHLDPKINIEVANKVKSEWARNFFLSKRGQYMLVAENSSGIVGFLQLLAPKPDQLIIDLIAVAETARGQGLAGAMISFAESNISDIKSIVVGTQVANTSSVRLYENLGFRLINAGYILHWHS